MPQFDFHHVFWPQLVWLGVFFAILYFGVVRLTLPKLGRVMAAREHQVTGDLAAADSAKANADRMAAAHEAGLAAAQNAARATLQAAQVSASSSIEAKRATSKTVLDARSAEAEMAISAARVRALGEIEGATADAAADIVEKLTGHRPIGEVAIDATRAAMA
ncbi:hypothetical protein [Sphingomonas bacterium]|uniref:F0F1 ATP synthase subunit B family protein n=1 Tax=Sphingomonas bacterium TaxID=1895847 RepID=UPI001575EAD0|nr:hypothetical protein [Sphingomonas bacterium]